MRFLTCTGTETPDATMYDFGFVSPARAARLISLLGVVKERVLCVASFNTPETNTATSIVPIINYSVYNALSTTAQGELNTGKPGSTAQRAPPVSTAFACFHTA